MKTRAVEPDVIVGLAENASRTVAVNGVVGKPSVVPLGLSSERLTDVIAKAGGSSQSALRHDGHADAWRQDRQGAAADADPKQPRENVYARPGDQLFLTHDPQTFSVLGSTGKSAKIPLGAASISVIEAAALAGGADPARAEHQGGVHLPL